jgi:NADH-quinone oxidoreductase subunit A
LFPLGFVSSPKWFRDRAIPEFAEGIAQALRVPTCGARVKSALAMAVGGRWASRIARRSDQQRPVFVWRLVNRQYSLSCAPCCAALSLGTIPINESADSDGRSKKVWPMNGILQDYLPLVVFVGVAAAIGLVLLIAPFLVAFQQPDAEKLSAYECGFNAFDDARMKFDVRFYLVAILFIIFDLEVAFLFPWAVAYGKLGATGFWSMFVFLAVLTVGFAYEWKKGALEWD